VSMSSVRSLCYSTRLDMPQRRYFTVSTSNAMISWQAWVPQRASSMVTISLRPKVTTPYIVKSDVI